MAHHDHDHGDIPLFEDSLEHVMLFDGQAYAVGISARETVAQAQKVHALSPTTTAAMGRLLMGALLCASDLKAAQGDVSVSFDGGGPAGKSIAVATAQGTVRGTMMNPGADLPLRADGKLDVGGVLGSAGRLTIIKDNGGQEPYIGQVQIHSGEVAEDFAYYYALSEQRPCLIFLGVVIGQDGTVLGAGGLGVFPLPGCEPYVLDALETRIDVANHLSGMLSGGRPLDKCLEVIFDGMDMKQTQRLPISYQCNCSRARMEKALISLGKEELASLIEQDGKADLTCHFCNTTHHFDQDELQALLDGARS